MTRVLKLKKISLTAQIGIALLLAVLAGILLRNQADFVNTYIKSIGVIFLNLLKFIVVPLVLFSIMAGILSMNDISKVGKLGLRTILYFITTTLFAVTLGLVVPSLLKGVLPTIHISASAVAEVVDTPRLSVMEQIVEMFPSNILAPVSSMAMMQIIVIALFFGIAMVHVGEKGEMARKVTLSFNDVVCKILEYIMALAPIGVFCMLTPVVVENGPAVLGSYAALLGLAYLCFAVHAGVVYSSAVGLIGRLSPLKFFKELQPAMLFAFSSDSSVATVGRHHQYGRGGHLLGCGLRVYGQLLWHRSYDEPVFGHCLCLHGSLHRHAGHSRRQLGLDGDGVRVGRHPRRVRGRGRRHRPPHRYGPHRYVGHRRRLLRGGNAADCGEEVMKITHYQ